jgi:large subunit ribosomal protein L9
MEVILCQKVPKVGKIGDVVKVKDGFARNFLLPQKLACLATPDNKRRIEHEKAIRLKEETQAKKTAQEFADRIAKVSCTVTVEVNDLDKLYGSVSDIDIAKALELEGLSIDRKMIELEKPIDELGIFEVSVKIHPEVTAKVRVWVAKK